MQIHHIFFTHFSAEGYLDCFQVLSITNNGAIKIVEQESLGFGLASFGYLLGGLEVGWDKN